MECKKVPEEYLIFPVRNTSSIPACVFSSRAAFSRNAIGKKMWVLIYFSVLCLLGTLACLLQRKITRLCSLTIERSWLRYAMLWCIIRISLLSPLPPLPYSPVLWACLLLTWRISWPTIINILPQNSERMLVFEGTSASHNFKQKERSTMSTNKDTTDIFVIKV
jgi:hypothetical protein